MPAEIDISIVLCTRDRARALQETLVVLEKSRVPADWKVELLVIDNGSKDDTAEIVRNAKLSRMQIRYLYEGEYGKARALNTGLAHAKGDIILFTDDDVEPSENWIEELGAPLLNNTCDAVTGLILLSPQLERKWMSPMHRWWLASSDHAELYKGSKELIGANMGFKRSVLRRVPRFDPELGPGALGLFEDTVFGWQLVEAGFVIGYAPNACAIHQPDPSRLWRASWLSEARKHGRCQGYLLHHWEHSSISFPRLRQVYYWIKLVARRALQPPLPMTHDGCAAWEISYVGSIEMCKQFRVERRRPRNYTRGEAIMRPSPMRPSKDEIPVSIPAVRAGGLKQYRTVG